MSTTVKHLILAVRTIAEIILTPLILAFFLAELLVMQYYLLNIEYSKTVIFMNLPRSQNVRNKGQEKILGFTICRINPENL